MSLETRFGHRFHLSTLSFFVFFIFLFLVAGVRSDGHVRHPIHTSSYHGQQPREKVGISHELHKPVRDLAAIARKSPSRLVKRAVNYQSYVCKGSTTLNMIIQDPPAARVWTQRDFNTSGWTTVNDVKEVSPDLVPALQGLGVPHAPEKIHPVFADQYDNFTDRNGRRNTVSI